MAKEGAGGRFQRTDAIGLGTRSEVERLGDRLGERRPSRDAAATLTSANSPSEAARIAAPACPRHPNRV